jgi:ATP-dependent Clp protease ATP-binding subunit ClpA
LGLILDLILRNELKLALAQGIELTLTDEAKQWLLAQNDQPEFGARPLRRIIARHVREPLADFLLREGAKGGMKVVVGVKDGALEFDKSNG